MKIGVFIFSLMLMSCGGGPEKDAQRMCDLRKAYLKAKKENNEAEIIRISEEGERLDDECKARYKSDKDYRKKYFDKLAECEAGN